MSLSDITELLAALCCPLTIHALRTNAYLQKQTCASSCEFQKACFTNQSHTHVIGTVHYTQGHHRVLCLQGACKDAIPESLSAELGEPALLPLLPNQCLVLVDATLVSLQAGDKLWLDGLYLREVATTRRMFAFVTQLFDPSELYLTAVTLQETSGPTADGGPVSGGLHLQSSTYAEGIAP